MSTTPPTREIAATLPNLVDALGTQQFCRIGFDVSLKPTRKSIPGIPRERGEIVVAPCGTGAWHQLTDLDATDLRVRLAHELGFRPIRKGLMRDALLIVATRNKFNGAAK